MNSDVDLWPGLALAEEAKTKENGPLCKKALSRNKSSSFKNQAKGLFIHIYRIIYFLTPHLFE